MPPLYHRYSHRNERRRKEWRALNVCVCVCKRGGGTKIEKHARKSFCPFGGKTRKEKMFLLGKWRELGGRKAVFVPFSSFSSFFRSGKCTSVSRKPFFSKQNAPRRHHPPVYEALLLQQMLFGRRKERGKEGATNIGISMQGEKEKRKKPFGNREWEESPFTIFAEGGRRSRLSAAISIAKKE